MEDSSARPVTATARSNLDHGEDQTLGPTRRDVAWHWLRMKTRFYNQILQMIGPLVVVKEGKQKKYRRGHRFARKAGGREQTDGLD